MRGQLVQSSAYRHEFAAPLISRSFAAPHSHPHAPRGPAPRRCASLCTPTVGGIRKSRCFLSASCGASLLQITTFERLPTGTCLAARCPTLLRQASHPCERGAGLLEE